MKIQRYGIYLTELDPSRGAEMAKTRPAVVVSDNEMNAALKTVVICPLTTALHPEWRSRIPVLCAGKNAEIAVDQIRTVSRERFRQRLGVLSAQTAVELRQLITEMYGEE